MKKRKTAASGQRSVTRKPRLTLAKLQARVRQLDAALFRTGELHTRLHKRMQDDRLVLLAALKDAVKIIDVFQRQSGFVSGWIVVTEEQKKQIEAARLLSLGV
jgi:hypothetical protein